MGAMAQGLFASLLIGTIFKAIGMIPGLTPVRPIGGYAKAMAGPAMRPQSPTRSVRRRSSSSPLPRSGMRPTRSGGPAALWRSSLSPSPPREAGRAVSKKTRVDILVTPFVTLFSGRPALRLPRASDRRAHRLHQCVHLWAALQAPFVTGWWSPSSSAWCSPCRSPAPRSAPGLY
jgi:hypothetical protein